MIYICDLCGGQSEEPHGCKCGGRGIPSGPPPGFTEGPPMVFRPLRGLLDPAGVALPFTSGYERLDPPEE